MGQVIAQHIIIKNKTMVKNKDLREHSITLLNSWIKRNPETDLAQKCANEIGFKDAVNGIVSKINIYGCNTSFTDVIIEINQSLKN